jgi:transcriptional regulator with XRE-family HTH domain
MTFNYRKLKGKIVEVYGSQRQFAKALGISNEAVSKKMQGKTPYRQMEMVTISEMLGFPLSDVDKYFFCRDGSINRTKVRIAEHE